MNLKKMKMWPFPNLTELLILSSVLIWYYISIDFYSIKQCTSVNMNDFITAHHEMGNSALFSESSSSLASLQIFVKVTFSTSCSTRTNLWSTGKVPILVSTKRSVRKQYFWIKIVPFLAVKNNLIRSNLDIDDDDGLPISFMTSVSLEIESNRLLGGKIRRKSYCLSFCLIHGGFYRVFTECLWLL